MPILKQLTCRVEYGPHNIKLSEYATEYGDGIVTTYVPIPSNSHSFNIHLTSSGYIAPGLAMFVFMDGKHQCNRNRSGLVMPDMNTHTSLYEIDFRVRQKEEKFHGQHFLGREWTFGDLQTIANPTDQNARTDEDVLAGVGTIEVIILRCVGGQTGCESAIDDGGDLHDMESFDLVDGSRLPSRGSQGFSSLNLDGPCEHDEEERGRQPNRRHVQFAGGPSTPPSGPNQRLRSPPPPQQGGSYADLMQHREEDDRPPTRHGRGHGMGDLGQSPPWQQSSYQLPLSRGGGAMESSYVGGGRGYSLFSRPTTRSQTAPYCANPAGSYYDHASSSYRRPDMLAADHGHHVGRSFQDYWANEPDPMEASDAYGWPLNQEDNWSTVSGETKSSDRSTIKANNNNNATNDADTFGWNNNTDNTQNDWRVNEGDNPDGNNDNAASGWNSNDNAASGNAAPGWNSNDNATSSNFASGWNSNDNAASGNAASGWNSNDNAASGWSGGKTNAEAKSNSQWSITNNQPYANPSKRRKRDRESTPADEVAMADAPSQPNNNNPTRPRIQPYWAKWYDQPGVGLPETESGRNPYLVAAETPLVLPENVAQNRSISHHIHVGQGRLYQHITSRPVYIDSMQDPYAVFVFNYRSRTELQTMLPNVEIKEDRIPFRDRMQDVPRDELVEMLIRAKGRAGYSTDSSMSSTLPGDPDIAMSQPEAAIQEQDPMSGITGEW